ncbi:MAG: hypothetical protein ISR65_07460 [Bacteriovoracaceae bacterium]|nr:hypothetical protein [Bacteriovoracaceae bacterium]
MKWIEFEEKHRPRFESFIKDTCIDLFNKLSAFEKSYFYHYWLKIFNEHHCFVLSDQGVDKAFVSKPQWRVKHWIRWPENILLVKADFLAPLNLPAQFKDELNFRTLPQSPLKNTSQTAYVCLLENFQYQDVSNLNTDIDCFELKGERIDEIATLLDAKNRHADVSAGFYEKYYLPELIQYTKLNCKQQIGFGFYATKIKSSTPIAYCFYNGFEMPLTGTPCLLVNDIVVKKEFRRQKVATTLQAFAYDKLKQANISWVLGNIKEDNISSKKQAMALGRFAWSSTVKLE